MLTAIEAKRADGDTREIKVVFQDVVDSHFGGYLGIEEVAAGQEKALTSKIRKAFRAILSSYLNWKILVFIVVAMGLTYSLPDSKFTHNVLLIVIFLFAFSPMVYAAIFVNKKIKTAKGKRSLLKGQLISQAYLPVIFLNGALYLPTIFFVDDVSSTGFKLYKQLPLPALMLVAVVFMVLNLSTIALCKQFIRKEMGR